MEGDGELGRKEGKEGKEGRKDGPALVEAADSLKDVVVVNACLTSDEVVSTFTDADVLVFDTFTDAACNLSQSKKLVC